jgi:type I restriction enzyme, R subunit
MSFTESNTVEAYLYDLLSGPTKPVAVNVVHQPESHYGRAHKGLGWCRVASADIPRQPQEVLVEKWVREALIRLNPEIAAQPDRADEVLYKLRAIILSVRSDGLIRANDRLAARRALHALRPEQRACAGALDRLRQA